MVFRYEENHEIILCVWYCNIAYLHFFLPLIHPWLCIIECIVPPPPYHQYHVTPSLIFIMKREMMFIHDMISVIFDSTKEIYYPRDTKKYFSSIYIKIIVYEKSDRVDVALFHRKDDRIMGYFFCIVLVKNIDRLIIVTWHWNCYV